MKRPPPQPQPHTQVPDPTLKQVRCPNCNRLLCRWKALNGKIEIVCPRCRCPVVMVTQLPIAAALAPKR